MGPWGRSPAWQPCCRVLGAFASLRASPHVPRVREQGRLDAPENGAPSGWGVPSRCREPVELKAGRRTRAKPESTLPMRERERRRSKSIKGRHCPHLVRELVSRGGPGAPSQEHDFLPRASRSRRCEFFRCQLLRITRFPKNDVCPKLAAPLLPQNSVRGHMSHLRTRIAGPSRVCATHAKPSRTCPQRADRCL